MKKFRFKFDRLEKIREQDEEAMLLRLAVAQTDLAREEKTLAELVDTIEEFSERLVGMIKTGTNAGALAAVDNYRGSALGSACRRRENVRKAAEAVQVQREAFNEAHRKAEIIRKLREAQCIEHRKQGLKDEQKDMDEIAAIRSKPRAR